MRKLFFGFFFLSIILFGFFFPSSISAANLWTTPSSGSFSKGSTIKVNIGVNTAEAVNAVQANLNYPADKLLFTSVSTAGSALTIIAEKGGGGGVVRIAGGTPTPGFSGSKFIAAVYFTALADSGSAGISFAGDSAIFKDSDNQNVYSGGSGASFTFSSQAATPQETQATPEADKSQEETSTAPIISEVKVTDVTKKSVTITWNTDVKASSVVEWGLTDSYGVTNSDEELVTEHKIELASELLLPGVDYRFRVISRDAKENETVGDGSSFRTSGYEITIGVLDKTGKPIKGAEVLLYSEPRRGTTDEDGKVVFTDVSTGKHGLAINYRGLTETKEVEVMETETPQTFEVKIAKSRLSIATFLPYIIGVLILFLVIGFGFYWKKIKRNKLDKNVMPVSIDVEPPAEKPSL